MIELFEQDIRTNDRQSSKGNQLKWEKSGVWYKADYTGYEGLAEYVISQLLKHSCLWINSKGNVSLQIGLQKNCLSNSKPSNSLI